MYLKLTGFSLILLSMSIYTQAQQNFSFGVKGGLNYATLAGDVEDVSPIIGYHLGLYSTGMHNERCHFGAELQYTSQGAKNTDNERIKFDYLVMAFPFRFFPTGTRLNIQLGPQFGYLLQGKSGDIDMKDDMHHAEFSAIAGVGYKVTSTLEVMARYNHGITPTIDFEPPLEKTKSPNSVIQISVAFSFFGK